MGRAADPQRFAGGQVFQSGQCFTRIGGGDRQVAADRNEVFQPVQIRDGVFFVLASDGEVAFDGVDSAPGESVHFGLRPKCQTAIGRNVGALYRIEVGAVVLIVVGADQKLPLLVPVGDSRRVGVDRGVLA